MSADLVFINKRKQRIVWTQVKPEGTPKAIYFFHSGYPHVVSIYNQYLQKLADNGLWVFNYDHHGHGRSDPPKPNNLLLEDYHHLVDDSLQFIDEIVVPQAKKSGLYGSVPFIIGGESMGGLTQCLNALELKENVDGLVLLAPAIGAKMDSFHKTMATFSGTLNSWIPKTRAVSIAAPEKSFRDKRYIKIMKEDPSVDGGNMRVRTGFELMKAMSYLEDHESELNVPLLILFGDQDKICDIEPARRLFSKNKHQNKQFTVLKDAWHALVAEPDSDTSARETAVWIEDLVQTLKEEAYEWEAAV